MISAVSLTRSGQQERDIRGQDINHRHVGRSIRSEIRDDDRVGEVGAGDRGCAYGLVSAHGAKLFEWLVTPPTTRSATRGWGGGCAGFAEVRMNRGVTTCSWRRRWNRNTR